MQLDEKTFLRMAEASGELVFVDIETTNLQSDYGSVLMVSILPYNEDKVTTYSVKRNAIGNDQKVVREAVEHLNEMACWCTFYGKMFDIPFLRSRLLKWGMNLELDKRHHIDLYWIIRANTNTSRRSQAHLLNWLGTPHEKMSVSASTWSDVTQDPKALSILKDRCESDVLGLRDLYNRTKHFIRNIQR